MSQRPLIKSKKKYTRHHGKEEGSNSSSTSDTTSHDDSTSSDESSDPHYTSTRKRKHHSESHIKKKKKRRQLDDDELPLHKEKHDKKKKKKKLSSNKSKHKVERHSKKKKKLKKEKVTEPPNRPHPLPVTKSLPVISPSSVIATPTKHSAGGEVLVNKRKFAPMTKEEYEKQQSVLRRVVDPETGRSRLVKGDGEIVEEIVSRERHKAINKLATHGDGCSFQAGLRKLT